MKDWGLAHRFAGSGDGAAISGLVYDALRKKSSIAWIAEEAKPAPPILGALKQTHDLDVESIAMLFSGEEECAGHAPGSRARLQSPPPTSPARPLVLVSEFPQSANGSQFEASFGASAADENRRWLEACARSSCR